MSLLRVATALSLLASSAIGFEFQNGVNQAWVDFGADFGTSWGGQPVSAAVKANQTRALDDVASAGGNFVRYWLHCGADITPFRVGNEVVRMDERGEMLNDVRAYLDHAESRGIKVLLTLWSFDIADRGGIDYVTDTALMNSYMNNALEPFVGGLRGHGGLFGYDIVNEPEGMSQEFGWTNTRVGMSQVQIWINRLAGSIRRADPSTEVTVGSWSFQASTDAAGNTNYYSDERLVAAGGDADGTLTHYEVHYYDHFGTGPLCPFRNPKSYYNLNKPVVIAEFSEDCGTGDSIETLYTLLYTTGYDGAAGWQANGGGHCSDSLATLRRGMQAVSGGGTPLPPSPTPPPGGDNITPDDDHSCEEQAGWGSCGETWMTCAGNARCCASSSGHCCAQSCSVPPPGSDNVTPDDDYTCDQQAGWGACGESWMTCTGNARCCASSTGDCCAQSCSL
jgi:hypothetical protein